MTVTRTQPGAAAMTTTTTTAAAAATATHGDVGGVVAHAHERGRGQVDVVGAVLEAQRDECVADLLAQVHVVRLVRQGRLVQHAEGSQAAVLDNTVLKPLRHERERRDEARGLCVCGKRV